MFLGIYPRSCPSIPQPQITIFVMMSESRQNIIALIKEKVRKKDSTANIILFGSHARRDATKNSDWDILILLDRSPVDKLTEKEFRDELFEVELETNQPISTFVFSKPEWETNILLLLYIKTYNKREYNSNGRNF